MTVEKRLEQITLRIEKSAISREFKQEIYLTLQQALQAAVDPVLIKYLPSAQLKFLSQRPDKISPESFVSLIQNTLQNSAALKELNDLMLEVLDECERNLPKEVSAKDWYFQ